MIAILWIDEKKYYSYDANNHWTESKEQAATFKTMETARNFAKNGLKDKKDALEFINLDEMREVIEIPDLTEAEAIAAYDELRKAAEVFGKAAEQIPAIVKYYQKVQSEQDKLQEDLLHKFEFTSPGNIIFVKLGRMLKLCRLKRRDAKDRLGYMTALSNAKAQTILKVHRGHDELIENRDYVPRIAKELFE